MGIVGNANMNYETISNQVCNSSRKMHSDDDRLDLTIFNYNKKTELGS